MTQRNPSRPPSPHQRNAEGPKRRLTRSLNLKLHRQRRQEDARRRSQRPMLQESLQMPPRQLLPPRRAGLGRKQPRQARKRPLMSRQCRLMNKTRHLLQRQTKVVRKRLPPERPTPMVHQARWVPRPEYVCHC